MRKCRLCNQEKVPDEFYRLSRNNAKRDTRCKSCVSEIQKGIYEETKDLNKIRAKNIKRRYKMTVEVYEELLASGCEICGDLENLVIDHDHNCCPGKETCGDCVRGVLCWKHNLAEAAFKSTEEIERLLEYRRR